ncbi:hypothetical protein T492DRAFT_870614 [Pavlovales sp. CCMP2436]|nr:hypothetical protein T492DRAFT_870614 [Pavlovales sp. CCMP2436]
MLSSAEGSPLDMDPAGTIHPLTGSGQPAIHPLDAGVTGRHDQGLVITPRVLFSSELSSDKLTVSADGLTLTNTGSGQASGFGAKSYSEGIISHWRLAMAMYSGSATSSVVVLNDKLGLPDARFVIKDDSAVIFDLHLKPAEGRAVKIKASVHIVGSLKLDIIDAVSGTCTFDQRGLICMVSGDSDHLEICAQTNDGSTITIEWRSLNL